MLMEKTDDALAWTGERTYLARIDYRSGHETRVNGFCPFEQTASLGAAALERRNCADKNSRDHANQCSACAGAGTTGTGSVSALARMVSEREAEKRKEAPGTGRDLVFCSQVRVGSCISGETGSERWC